MFTSLTVSIYKSRLYSMGGVYILLLVVCVALLGAWADPIRQPRPQPRPCCMKNKFEITAYNQIGYYDKKRRVPGQKIELVRLHYDATAKKIALDVTDVSNGDGLNSTSFRVIEDFSRRRAYIVKGETCTFVPLKVPFTKYCIPASARFVGSAYFGGNDNKFVFDTWQTVVPVEGARYFVTLSVSQNDCILVSEILMGESRGIASTTNLGLTGYTEGIQDPAVFRVPGQCRRGTESDFSETTALTSLANHHKFMGDSSGATTKQQPDKLLDMDREFNDLL